MPTYEYECTSCGHRFDAFQNMSDKLLTKCEKCGKKVKRLIGSGAGIIFKGTGFYATDYRKSPKTESSKSAPACPAAQKGCSGCDKKR
jgi:putative FmdB family regulatory protein